MRIGYDLGVVGATVLFLIIGIHVLLSTRKQRVLGFVMPTLFLILGGSNLYKSLYVYNPYPTMKEGMLMTFGLLGFGISAVTLAVCRVIEKRSR